MTEHTIIAGKRQMEFQESVQTNEFCMRAGKVEENGGREGQLTPLCQAIVDGSVLQRVSFLKYSVL